MKLARLLVCVALAAVLCINFMTIGCAGLQTAACNPPANVIAVAQAAAPLVATAINMFIPGSVAYVTAVTVQGAVTAILGGACVTLTQLDNLIAWLQSDAAKTLQAKAMVKAGPMKAAAVIDPQALIDWRKAQFGK